MRTCTALLVASTLVGCVDREVSKVEVDSDRVYTNTVSLDLGRKLDLLFVIDNSGSMAGEQASLAAEFPRFMEILQRVEGGAPDLHIGVVTSDVGAAGRTDFGPQCAGQGDDGKLQRGQAGCAAVAGDYIVDAPASDRPGGRRTNYTGTLGDAFACMADLGTGGCGFEMHLEAMRRALDPARNPGFLRPEAALGVIIVADEDDCSTELPDMFAADNVVIGARTSFRCFEQGITCDQGDLRSPGLKTGCHANPSSRLMFEVDAYVDFLRGLKAGHAPVLVAGIIGPGGEVGRAQIVDDPGRADASVMLAPSCDRDPATANDEAVPAFRLAEFLRGFARPSTTSICAASLAGPLTEIANNFVPQLGTMCVDTRLVDRVPTTPEPDPDCTVTEILDPRGTPEPHALPRCGEGVTPCWRFEVDALCPAPTFPESLALVIERGGAAPPTSSTLQVQCVAAPSSP
jgi:hypothetical protein